MPAYKLLLEFDTQKELKEYVAGLTEDWEPKALSDLGNRELPPAKTAVKVDVPEFGGDTAAEDGTPAFLKSEKKKPGRKPKDSPPAIVAMLPVEITNAAVNPEPVKDLPHRSEAKAEEIPYRVIQEATMNYHKEFGREKTLVLLGEYGVKIATDIKKDRYADYLERVKELTARNKAEGDLA